MEELVSAVCLIVITSHHLVLDKAIIECSMEHYFSRKQLLRSYRPNYFTTLSCPRGRNRSSFSHNWLPLCLIWLKVREICSPWLVQLANNSPSYAYKIFLKIVFQTLKIIWTHILSYFTILKDNLVIAKKYKLLIKYKSTPYYNEDFSGYSFVELVK